MVKWNYGSRNGMSSVVFLIREICRVYTKFSGAIIAYVNASSMTPTEKTTVLDWLNKAVTVCAIIEATVAVTYE